MVIRRTVLLPLATRRSFFDHYFEQNGAAGVWIFNNTSQPVGAEVDLEIAFAEEQMVFHSRGIVRSKRLVGRKNLPAGMAVEFLPSARRSRDVIVSFARGEPLKLVRRQSRRLPVSLPVEYRGSGGGSRGVTEDLSREGAFICGDIADGVGSELAVRFEPEDGQPIDLRAEVRWQRTSSAPGVGVRFIFESAAHRRQVAELVDKIKRQMVL